MQQFAIHRFDSLYPTPPKTPMSLAARLLAVRRKTTSSQHVAARHLDHTFEKLMSARLPLIAAAPLLDVLLASPCRSLPLAHLPYLPSRLHRRSPLHFLRLYPRLFSVSPPVPLTLRLSPAAASLLSVTSDAAASVDRLRRLLAMSLSRSLPLRAVFRVWRELALPDDFERLLFSHHSHIFRIADNPAEPNTHVIQLVEQHHDDGFRAAVEKNRADDGGGKYAFKMQFPPGMRLTKEYRKKVKEWQLLPYAGPYETVVMDGGKEKKKKKATSKAARRRMEKRAVAIAHEFLSLTVENMVEVEKFSQFRKWFGIELNVRDLFLDHPGIFYLSAKGKRHTVFLREAYDCGRLVEPNPVSDARRRLVDLMLLRRRGLGNANAHDSGSDLEELS